MLLYIFKDGAVKVVADNPTVIEMLAVVNGTLSIFKGDSSGYYRLIVLKDKMCWERVIEGKIFSCANGRIHQ